MDKILIDNFFNDPDKVRTFALSREYNESTIRDGWKGFRMLINEKNVMHFIKHRLTEIDFKFDNLHFNTFFHYSTENNRKELGGPIGEHEYHRDVTEWAGVIYLTPNPVASAGTSFLYDDGKTEDVENVYNRLIFYPGNILHRPSDVFGKDINDGRLTLTIFGNIINTKKDKTLL